VAPSFHFVPLPLFVLQENERTMQTLDLGLGYSFYDYYKYHTSTFPPRVVSCRVVSSCVCVVSCRVCECGACGG
jgi:hypothetical protein